MNAATLTGLLGNEERLLTRDAGVYRRATDS
jgi:hypothetical protein